MSFLDIILALPNWIMAAGAILILCQIHQTKKQAVTDFEDSLDKEYRDLIHRLPVKTVLGEELNDEEFAEHLDEFFAYIDLCNQEVFLRERRRVSKRTWGYWADGIRSNLHRPAFKHAWEIVKDRLTDDFTELKRLELSDFRDDPAEWNIRWYQIHRWLNLKRAFKKQNATKRVSLAERQPVTKASHREVRDAQANADIHIYIP